MNYNHNGTTYVGLWQINTVISLRNRLIGIYVAKESLLVTLMITWHALFDFTLRLAKILGVPGRQKWHASADCLLLS